MEREREREKEKGKTYSIAYTIQLSRAVWSDDKPLAMLSLHLVHSVCCLAIYKHVRASTLANQNHREPARTI